MILDLIQKGDYVNALAAIEQLGEASKESKFYKTICLVNTGQEAEALALFERGDKNLYSPDLFNCIGALYCKNQNLPKAEELWVKAWGDGEHIQSAANLIKLKFDQKLFSEALAWAVKVRQHRDFPTYDIKFQYEIVRMQGNCWLQLKNATQARLFLLEAISMDPTQCQAYLDLAQLYTMMEDGDNANNFTWKGIAQQNYTSAQFFSAFKTFRSTLDHKALGMFPADRKPLYTGELIPVLEASLIQELSFNDDELLRQNVTKWAASKRRSSGFDNLKLGSAKPSNKIKVGFLTGDARLHSVGKLLKPFIEFLIQEDDIEVFVYNNMENPFADPINQWFKDNTNYRYINGRSDFDVARDIRMDGINVLFDCSSHTDNNRLEVLLYKPAPCIVSYLAFPFTTGLPEVDYIVTDWACKRAEWWPEKALEMPSICYVEMEKSEALRLPFLESGIFTFGSLAPPYKITPETLDLWAAVLRANPKAQFYYARPELRHRTIQTNFLNEMLMRGVDSSRIRLETNEGQKHWHHYTKIDVILDTLWLTGGLSTIDACRMGVPTLSVQGPNYWNNLSMSLQHNLFKAHGGHKDKEHLIENATQLATDIDYYIKVRKIFNESNEAEEGREAWKQDMLKFLRSQSSLNS